VFWIWAYTLAGNFHENIKYSKEDPEQVRKAKFAVDSMVERAIQMDGTCTGEHGVGYGKKAALQKELGSETLALMVRKPSYISLHGWHRDLQRVIKNALDPHWIM
jgi:D-lactate dehydrogenase (cytochrome)